MGNPSSRYALSRYAPYAPHATTLAPDRRLTATVAPSPSPGAGRRTWRAGRAIRGERERERERERREGREEEEGV